MLTSANKLCFARVLIAALLLFAASDNFYSVRSVAAVALADHTAPRHLHMSSSFSDVDQGSSQDANQFRRASTAGEPEAGTEGLACRCRYEDLKWANKVRYSLANATFSLGTVFCARNAITGYTTDLMRYLQVLRNEQSRPGVDVARFPAGSHPVTYNCKQNRMVDVLAVGRQH
jgi:hypothetical protein